MKLLYRRQLYLIPTNIGIEQVLSAANTNPVPCGSRGLGPDHKPGRDGDDGEVQKGRHKDRKAAADTSYALESPFAYVD